MPTFNPDSRFKAKPTAGSPGHAAYLTILSVCAAMAACDATSHTTTPGGEASQATAGNQTPPIRSSTAAPALAMAGLDVKNLPNLPDIIAREQMTHDRTEVHVVMESFDDALGVKCNGCHVSTSTTGRLNFAADTRNKRIASRMYSDWVERLRFKDGSDLYCDSCHQGKAKSLQKGPELATWMQHNFVDKLEFKTGDAVTCETCHGTPFNPTFLDAWGEAHPQ